MTAESPLGARSADLERLGATELAFLAQLDVRAPAETAAELGFPLEPNTVVADDDRDVLWLGPDEWLVVGAPGSAPSLLEELSAALGGLHASIVDVSANRAVIDLGGAARHELLSKGCGLDLHPRSWRPGLCAQTLLARIPVLLYERGDVTRVFVRPSFASWLVDWLLDAAGLE